MNEKPEVKTPTDSKDAKDGGEEFDLQLDSAVQLLKSWQIFSTVKF
jgi:hypothetical protein